MGISVKEGVILAPHTIYKIGGPARFFVEVKNSGELKEALEFAAEKGVDFFILGAGSNVLISDKGFDGLVIKMNMRDIHLAGSGKLVAESGVSMAQAVLILAKAGLTGFEWGIGVPGTIGGSVRGNAGCFGGEMKDVIESVTAINFGKSDFPRKSDFLTLTNLECEFTYRDSVFKKHPEWIILSITLKLKEGDTGIIQENIKRIMTERSQKQDIGTKSCGCIFKNVLWAVKDTNRGSTPVTTRVEPLWDKEKLLARFPKLKQFANQSNIPASFLIDQAGLKGKCFGKICISPKHANFFVNEGGATAEEVIVAIAVAKDAVKNKYGILLEEEIEHVGF